MSEKLIVLAAAIQAKAAPTARADAINHLVKAANCFDEAGLCKEADAVTGIIERLADGYTGRPDDWCNDCNNNNDDDDDDLNDAKKCNKGKKKTPEEKKVFQFSGFLKDDDYDDDDPAWEDEE
jgi:hypothetical protein